MPNAKLRCAQSARIEMISEGNTTIRNLHSRNDTERAQGSNDLKCTEHALAAGTAGR